jgi:hypothetical protein
VNPPPLCHRARHRMTPKPWAANSTAGLGRTRAVKVNNGLQGQPSLRREASCCCWTVVVMVVGVVNVSLCSRNSFRVDVGWWWWCARGGDGWDYGKELRVRFGVNFFPLVSCPLPC